MPGPVLDVVKSEGSKQQALGYKEEKDKLCPTLSSSWDQPDRGAASVWDGGMGIKLGSHS